MNIGDTIKCADEAETAKYKNGLAQEGIICSVLYNMYGQEGFYLRVDRIEGDKDGCAQKS